MPKEQAFLAELTFVRETRESQVVTVSLPHEMTQDELESIRDTILDHEDHRSDWDSDVAYENVELRKLKRGNADFSVTPGGEIFRYDSSLVGKADIKQPPTREEQVRAAQSSLLRASHAVLLATDYERAAAIKQLRDAADAMDDLEEEDCRA